MIVKIIWVLISINAIVLLIFLGLFIASSSGRNVDYMEKGWMTILFVLGFIIILLAVIPLRISHSNTSIFIAGFFAALPLLIASITFISKKFPSSPKSETLAEFYYKNKTQRKIAAAIEQNDTVLCAKLIKGQNLNIQGNRVWNGDGLSYLQFAIRLRRDKDSFTLNEEANNRIIRMLLQHGAAATPALSEAIICLPVDMIELLFDHGANANTPGFVSSNPLLFEAIGKSPQKNDMGILLIRKGADVNVRNDYDQTPLIYAATSSGTSHLWNDCWRIVLYLLKDAHADYKYTRSDGINFSNIVGKIEIEAAEKKLTMPPDFLAVKQWLKEQPVDTTR